MLTIFSVLLSITTIITMWLVDNGDKQGWILGLGNQGLWIMLIVITEAWGLFLLTATLIFVYARNLIKWRRNEGPYTHVYRDESLVDWPRRIPEWDDEMWNYEDDGNPA